MLQEEKETRQISGVGFVLAVYATSRIFYLIAGFLLAKFVPTSSHQLTTTDVPPGTLNIWSYWDGEHYVALALNGYFQAPRYISPAFFPMYPLLLRSFSTVFGGPLSKEAFSYWGSLLSLLFLPFAFYFIYQIAYEGWDERTAKGTLLALAFFPTTFFLNAHVHGEPVPCSLRRLIVGYSSTKKSATCLYIGGPRDSDKKCGDFPHCASDV